MRLSQALTRWWRIAPLMQNESDSADVLVADLVKPGVATKLNDGPFIGAGFTPWEDVEWRGNSVLFNAPEPNCYLQIFTQPQKTNPDTPTNLSRQVGFSINQGSFASGVSHFVQSPDSDLTAMIDGDPALNLFVIDRSILARRFNLLPLLRNGYWATSQIPIRIRLCSTLPLTSWPW